MVTAVSLYLCQEPAHLQAQCRECVIVLKLRCSFHKKLTAASKQQTCALPPSSMHSGHAQPVQHHLGSPNSIADAVRPPACTLYCDVQQSMKQQVPCLHLQLCKPTPGSPHSLIDGDDLPLDAIQEAGHKLVAPGGSSIAAIRLACGRVDAGLQVKDLYLQGPEGLANTYKYSARLSFCQCHGVQSDFSGSCTGHPCGCE